MMFYAAAHARLFAFIKKADNNIFQKWRRLPPTSSGTQQQLVMLGSGAIVAVLVVVVAATAASTMTKLVSTANLEKSAAATATDDGEKSRRRRIVSSYQFPVNFMDKLAAKPYLRFADFDNVTTSRQRRRRNEPATAWTNNNEDDDDSNSSRRPVGVPRNLRLLLVDLPEMRKGGGYFSGGQCRMAADRVYPDGIAPPVLLQPRLPPESSSHPNNTDDDDDDMDSSDKNGAPAAAAAAARQTKKVKNLTKTGNKNTKNTRHGEDFLDGTTTLSVEQKAWVKSMFRCFHDGSNSSSSSSSPRVGVRVMEAQTAALNPLNLRKTPHPILVKVGRRTNSRQQQQQQQYQHQVAVANDDDDDYDEKAVAAEDQQQRRGSSSINNNDATNSIIPSRFTWWSNPPRHDEQRNDSSPDGKKTSGDISNSSSVQRRRQQQQQQLEWLRTEAEAPWNQLAWREELELRISGQVAFGEELQEASGWWNRRVLGRIYQPTIPLYYTSRSGTSVSDWICFWRRPGPASSTTTRNDSAYIGRVEGGEDRLRQDDDVDDNDEEKFVVGSADWWQSNWSFHHKPHAVIANGSAMQRVPQSLRLLQKACREHDVPLYVIHDPRKWGRASRTSTSNNIARIDVDDDDELGAVLRDLHRSLKKRIITTSLQQQQLTGSRTAFQRGRWWGRLETNMFWESRETMRKSREAVEHVVQNAKALAAAQKREDWSLVDQATLEEKLVRHGVVRKENVKVVVNNDNANDEKNEEETGKGRQNTAKTMQRLIYSKAFSALAQQWVADQQAESKVAELVQNDSMSEDKKQKLSSPASSKDDKEPPPRLLNPLSRSS
jgi:hypothetical protein